jgi:transcriptional regulator with XRE-family HTH domain
MSEKNNTIGSRLRILLKSLKLTQDQFAESLEVSGSAINRYCTDQRTPNADVVFKIHRLYNVNPHWLLAGKEPMWVPEGEAERLDQSQEAIRFGMQVWNHERVKRIAEILLKLPDRKLEKVKSYLEGLQD